MGNQNEIIFISCTVTINTIAVFINFFVVIMFLSFQNTLLSPSNNKFLFSMAVADFLVGLFGIAGSILMYLLVNGHVSREIVQPCGFIPLFGSFFMSILSLSILTVDRWIAVEYALRYHSIITDFRANLLIGLTWLTIAVILIIQTFIYLGTSLDVELAIRTYQLTAFFMLATFILCVGNTKLHLTIRIKRQCVVASEVRDIDSQTETTDTRSSNANRHVSKRRLSADSKICIWMTMIFTVCWLPLIVYYIALANGKVPIGITATYIICASFSYMNSLLNPIIYLIKRKDFRKRFGEIFVHCKRSQ